MRYVLIIATILAVGCGYEAPVRDSSSKANAPRPQRAKTSVPSPTPETVQQPFKIGGDVMPPVPIKRVGPDFQICEGAKVRVRPVIVEAVIDERGEPRDVRILKHASPCIENAVLKSVGQWRFRPGTLNGKPVPVIWTMNVSIYVRR